MLPIACSSCSYILDAFPEVLSVALEDCMHRKDSKELNSALSSGASGLQVLVRFLSKK